MAKWKGILFIGLMFCAVGAALSFDTLEIDEFCNGNAASGYILVRNSTSWSCSPITFNITSNGTGTARFLAEWQSGNTLADSLIFRDAGNNYNFSSASIISNAVYTYQLVPNDKTSQVGLSPLPFEYVYADFINDRFDNNVNNVSNICTTDNGKCAGISTNNITGSFKSNFLSKGLNQTALISSTIQENTTAVKIGSNLDMGAYNMSTQGGTWYENVSTWFGASCVYPGFFGFEAFNGSNRCNINDYLGGFYTPTNSDRRFYFGYGGDKTGGIFCSESGKECAVAFSVNSTGSQVQFLRGGLTVNTVIQIGMRNARDFSIFVNESTGTGGGGNFNIGARMGGTIYQNQVHLIKVDNSTQALNVSGEVFAKNLTTTGSVFVGSLNAIGSGQVLCLLANKTIGTCTSVVGVTGACTCV